MNLTDYADIRRLLERHGFRFSKSMGQNFLIDASVPRRIAEASGADETCGVVEIGPGIGCLTEQLASRAGKVVSVELDRSLAPVLQETLEGLENIELVFGDVMKQDLRALAEEKLPGLTKLVCANLPYNITSPVLTAVVKAGCFERVCVMVQKEVAERICAGPGTRDYGAFGLFMQWYYEPELLFTVPPHCFVPQPKVTSAVVLLRRRETPLCEVADEELFFRVIRAAFNQRRKTLPNALTAVFPDLSKEETETILQKCGLDPKIRGEMLTLSEFAEISNEISARK